MKNLVSKILDFARNQIVLLVSWVLAAVSSAVIKPGINDVISFIDFRSLAILFCLMAVVQCFALNGFFNVISVKIVSSVKRVWQLVLSLVVLCFFFSMLITNDVALITFVPLTIMILNTAGLDNLMITVIVLETIAANTGSMLTPIGNPQNLYLYNLMQCDVLSFIKIMMPYSIMSLVLLVVSIMFIKDKNKKITIRQDLYVSDGKKVVIILNRHKIIFFALLGIIALLSVFKVIPYYISLVLVIAGVIFSEKKALKSVDYTLLLTFIGFFIFTGNLGSSERISSFISHVCYGNEVLCGCLLSQVISNVPCTLLLSSFTSNLDRLTVGVNIGGLGSIIASMASLISYKLYIRQKDAKGGLYMLVFTVFNVSYLVILYSLYLII